MSVSKNLYSYLKYLIHIFQVFGALNTNFRLDYISGYLNRGCISLKKIFIHI